MKIGAKHAAFGGYRVEAGWLSIANSESNYYGPRGTIVATDGTHFRVRWDNGYEASFPRVELRLALRAKSRSRARTEAIEGTAAQSPTTLEMLRKQPTALSTAALAAPTA